MRARACVRACARTPGVPHLRDIRVREMYLLVRVHGLDALFVHAIRVVCVCKLRVMYLNARCVSFFMFKLGLFAFYLHLSHVLYMCKIRLHVLLAFVSTAMSLCL